jgi:hypothetical protein
MELYWSPGLWIYFLIFERKKPIEWRVGVANYNCYFLPLPLSPPPFLQRNFLHGIKDDMRPWTHRCHIGRGLQFLAFVLVGSNPPSPSPQLPQSVCSPPRPLYSFSLWSIQKPRYLSCLSGEGGGDNLRRHLKSMGHFKYNPSTLGMDIVLYCVGR